MYNSHLATRDSYPRDPELITIILCGIGKMFCIAGFIERAKRTLEICEKRAKRLGLPGLDLHVRNYKALIGFWWKPLQSLPAGAEALTLANQLGDKTMSEQLVPILLQLCHVTCDTRRAYQVSRDYHLQARETNVIVLYSRSLAYYSFVLIVLNNPAKALDAIDSFLRFDNGKAMEAGWVLGEEEGGGGGGQGS